MMRDNRAALPDLPSQNMGWHQTKMAGVLPRTHRVAAMKPKPCKECGSPYHTAWFHKPRKPLVTNARLNQVGKQGKKTAAAVAKWKASQKPNHRGNYVCYICKREVPYLMAEHVKSKARHPEARTDLANLKPTCADCNRQKGSKDN